MEKVRVGIIGLGTQGGTYAGFLGEGKVKNVVIGALCDSDPVKKAIYTEKYSDIPFYDDYIEMMESGNVDAVVTCVPHYLHPEMGINALKRNIHALVEKPAGVHTKQVRELNEFAASKPELTFGIMFNQRTNPLYQKVKELVDSGEGGGVLVNQAPHQIDLMQWICGIATQTGFSIK